MPKRSRQAHIPSQLHKRKPRRPFGLTARDVDEDALQPTFADPPAFLGNRSTPALGGATGPVDTTPRVGRRMEMIARNREVNSPSVRVIPGQLPVFERSYLVTELRRIAMISGSLLAVILLLYFVMR